MNQPFVWSERPKAEAYIFCFYWTLGVMRTMPSEVCRGTLRFGVLMWGGRGAWWRTGHRHRVWCCAAVTAACRLLFGFRRLSAGGDGDRSGLLLTPQHPWGRGVGVGLGVGSLPLQGALGPVP